MRLSPALLSIAILLPSARAQAQANTVRNSGPDYTASGEPRFLVGFGIAASQPLGEFAHSVDAGGGFDVHMTGRLGASGAVALRFEGASIRYGEETTVLHGRIAGDVETANEIYWFSVGPQLMATRGRIRPYVNASLGYVDFNTNSSIKPKNDDEQSSGSTNNFDKRKLAFGTGGGMLVSLWQKGNGTGYLDIGARYHGIGRMQYLRQGAIEDLPDGTTRVTPTTSTANFLAYHVGISINTPF